MPHLVRCSTTDVIDFGTKTSFEIGRSQNSDLCLPTLAISRQQCSINYSPEVEEWKLDDLSSFKSTRVNGLKVPLLGSFISTGDKISFVNSPGFEYIFFKEDSDRALGESQAKRPRLLEEPNPSAESSQIKELSAKLESIEEQNSILRAENNEMWRELKNLKEKHKLLEEQHEKNTNDLILNQVVTDELKTDLECSCREIELLAAERNSMVTDAEKPLVSENADDELQNMIPEILKSVEMEALHKELIGVKEELRVAKESSEKEKSLASALMNIVDQEFYCCICSEVLFQPVVLNCKHSICRDCLEKWKKNKKECPECRTKIKMETEPLMLDRFIDRIAPILSQEFAQKRDEVRKERLASRIQETRTPVRGTPSRGRGRGRMVRRTRRISMVGRASTAGSPEYVDLTR